MNNILWGLALQLGWQFSSGRLFTNTTTLSSKSWWADINYQLIIIPLLGASAARYPGVPLMDVMEVTGADVGRFCRNGTVTTLACEPVQQALEDWTTFFTKLPEAERNCSTAIGQAAAFDSAIGLMWRAHTSSLHAGLPLFADKLTNFAEEESHFGTAWASLVEFVAAAHFNTDFNGTTSQQTLLPDRMLIKGDKAPNIANLPKLTNRGIYMVEKLSSLNSVSGGRVLKLWKRAMCSKEGRVEGRELINEGIRNPAVLIPGLFKIIGDALRPCD